jgi:hypothetical protein
MPKSAFMPRLLDLLVRRIASGLKVPETALRMFQTANETSGLDRRTLPTELIPLNTIQISRGLLNFTLLQNLDGWVLPYWAERQFDPEDPAFVPRSHLGLSINVTNRNWTAVGSLSCSAEPVVDPRGAVMPYRNRWTSECWLRSGDTAHFPSRAEDVRQTLRGGLPIVVTGYRYGEIRIQQTVHVSGRTLVQEVTAENTGGAARECTLAIAVRPFNAEGACLLREIRFERPENAFVMDGTEKLVLSAPPASVWCSNRETGDAAACFQGGADAGPDRLEASCPVGLAHGYAAFLLRLEPGESRSIRATADIENGENLAPGDITQTEAEWRTLLGSGTEIVTPDEHLNTMIRASLSTLLLLTDGDSITPGPWTYHQFWFRDAAVMLRALDTFGLHVQTRTVVGSFPSRQERSGYFRSQQGEWDVEFASEMMGPLGEGARWIARKRREEPGAGGLLPQGLSAEHLGLADRYFWDNWWSVAGLEAFAGLCALRGMRSQEEATRNELREYRKDIDRAVHSVQKAKGIDVIPAGPSRGIDCGMIGSCAPWYPLQLSSPDDLSMRATIEMLSDRYLLHGLFFQEFIHSGKNPYLTLQIAQSWLYAGERKRFWSMVADVLRHASPTLNFPEAIHSLSGGGTMGDGHHGWAAAEVALALRNAFVLEMWNPGAGVPRLALLRGIPAEWFLPGMNFAIRRAPVPGGLITIEGSGGKEEISLEIAYEKKSERGATEWTVSIPERASRVTVNTRAARSVAVSENETHVTLCAAGGRTSVSLERDTDALRGQPANL